MNLSGVHGRDLRAVYAQAEAAGCELTWTRRGHVRILTPEGPVFGPGTSRTTSRRTDR